MNLGGDKQTLIERHGPDARFQPIKTPDDMDKERPDIVAALRARGSL